MKYSLIAVTLLSALAASAAAQQRTINDNASERLLRIWPQTGVWYVLLGSGEDRKLGCAMLTGQIDQHNGEVYTWGIREKNKNVALFISDKNETAVAGNNITVIIDGAQIGTYPITKRRTKSGVYQTVAELSPEAGGKLARLLRVGGSIKFRTESATYAASLQGAARGMMNFTACTNEVRELNGTRASGN